MTNRDETGAISTEYALLISLVAVLIIGAVALVANDTNGLFTAICGPPSPFNC